MKKPILFFCFLLAIVSADAQLANTKWTGAIKGDNPRDAVLVFKKGGLSVFTPDGELIETMTCTVKGSVFTIKKLNGQSDCDNTVTGKYAFTIKKDSLYIKLLADECTDRSSAINATGWKKQKNRR